MNRYLALITSMAFVATAGCAVESGGLEMGSVDQALTCDDSLLPPNNGTCAEAVAYGWCGQSWMNGACALSCQLCTPTTTTTTTASTLTPPATNLLGQSCTNMADTYSTAAALAVAVGKEMGRWQGISDFEIGTLSVYNEGWNWTATVDGVRLSAAGEALCQSKAGNCAEVRKLLSLQGRYDLWQADVFANRMKAGWQSLKADVDAGRCAAVGPTVTFLNTHVDATSCGGAQIEFSVSSTDPKVAACQMTLFDHGGTVQVAGVVVNGLTVYKTDNPFIMYTVASATTVKIDPTDSTTAGTSTSTLACWDAATGFVYDPSPKTKLGQCCYQNGLTKKLVSYTTTWDKCQ